MLAPDLQFMVHSSEVLDEEGFVHRGSRLTQLERGAEPPEWRLRDFAFAAYSGPNAPGLRQVHFGRRSVWGFASAREHTEEIVVFRKGSDARRKCLPRETAAANAMTLAPLALSLLGAASAVLPSCDLKKPTAEVCEEYCTSKCSFYNRSAGDTGQPSTLKLYRLTPPNVTGLRNKNTGDPRGDMGYWLSKKNMSVVCAQDPLAHGCVDYANNLYGIFTVEVDGQFGPYLQCNPVQGGGSHPEFDPLWKDSSNFSCGQSCVVATTKGCYNYGMPDKNGTSGWGDFHCFCDGSQRDGRSVGRAQPPFLAPSTKAFVAPQCGGFEPVPKGRCLAGQRLTEIDAWSFAATQTMACEECLKDSRCTGWWMRDNFTAELFTGNLTEVPGECSSGKLGPWTRRAGWFGVGDLGGLWYSTPSAGECAKQQALGTKGCTWKEVTSVYKNATCIDSAVDRLVELYGKRCFGTCGLPLNRTSDCYLDCYRDVLMGSAASNLTKIPSQRLVLAWEKAAETCPKVTPQLCRGTQCDPLEDIPELDALVV
ncbi:unnamed protein product [Effrenium voratum]|nr:unnamed protein product [Effrenium voratum]